MVRISGEKMNQTPDVLEARELLRCKDQSVMYSNALTKDTPIKLVHSQSLSPSWSAYLICLHSGFLTLQQGRTIVIEPYFPCKCGRQFGFYQDVLDEARINVREGNLQDVAHYWFNLTEHVTRSFVMIPASPDKKSTLVTMKYASWWQSTRGDLFSQECKQSRDEVVQQRRPARARVADDASAIVVTSRRVSVPKPIVLQIDKHALSPVDLENEGGGSSSLGLETSPQKSRTCSPGKEKIEALKGLGIGTSVDRAGNLSGSKSKPNSATSLSSSKQKSSNARSKNQVGGEVSLAILPPL